MNPDSSETAEEIAKETISRVSGTKNTEIVICPPFVFVPSVLKMIEKSKTRSVSVGAQDVFWEGFTGAFTGEVSPTMLAKLGLDYVIVGHSERRENGETDEVVGKKALAVAKEDMMAVVCVGEKERDENGVYFEKLKEQIRASLAKFQKRYVANLVIAYEPVWAIGKSEFEAMKGKDLEEMIIFIRKTLSDIFGAEDASIVPILYGGSVSARNVVDIGSTPGIAGLLVGRQSLEPEQFAEIARIFSLV